MSSAASEVCHGVRVKCPGRMITPGYTLLRNRYPSQKMTSQELSYPNPTTGILFRALQWWLLCRGIKTPSSWKKQQILER